MELSGTTTKLREISISIRSRTRSRSPKQITELPMSSSFKHSPKESKNSIKLYVMNMEAKSL